MRKFRLYPAEQHWWSFQDYGAVLDVMERLKPKRVLEFGPGSSTLALVEGGAQHIDCCEDDWEWEAVYRERLEQRFQGIVHVHAYRWSDPVVIDGIDDKTYDFALIDGPKQTERRAAIEYCLRRSKTVMFPREDHNNPTSGLRSVAVALARKYGRSLAIMETGPLSGSFALLS